MTEDAVTIWKGHACGNSYPPSLEILRAISTQLIRRARPPILYLTPPMSGAEIRIASAGSLNRHRPDRPYLKRKKGRP